MKQVTPPVHSISIILLTEAISPNDWIIDMIQGCRYLRPFQLIVVLDQDRQEMITQVRNLGCSVHAVDSRMDISDRRTSAASMAAGNTVLFLEQDCSLAPSQLLTFLQPVVYGSAHAVFLQQKAKPDDIHWPLAEEIWAACLTRMLNRDDLVGCSMNSTPYAFSLHALHTIGLHRLRNPSEAYAAILQSGLRIVPHAAPPKMTTYKNFNPLEYGTLQFELSNYEKRVIERYLEALSLFVTKPRGGFTDGSRRRDIVRECRSGVRQMNVTKPAEDKKGKRNAAMGGALSVIVPARNEEATIGPLLEELHKLEPAEIIVVDNGSQDATGQRALACGATVVSCPEALGTDTGRAIGAYHSTGDILLFVDGDLHLSAHDMYPFILAIERGYDVALNDLNYHLERELPARSIFPCIYALNLALQQKPLGISSMVMVPFSMSRKALSAIGWENLLCPPRAMTICLQQKLRVALPHRVNVDKINRLRPEKHFTGMAAEQIIGDHVEALYEFIEGQRSKPQ